MDVFKPDLAVFDLGDGQLRFRVHSATSLNPDILDALVIMCATGVTKRQPIFSRFQIRRNWTNVDLARDKVIRPDQILKEIKKLLKS